MSGLFSELNPKTNNHVFKKYKKYFKSRPATKEELKKARKGAAKGDWAFRSCWECNAAHIHLIDSPRLNCFSCGRFYHKGVDITDYK